MLIQKGLPNTTYAQDLDQGQKIGDSGGSRESFD